MQVLHSDPPAHGRLTQSIKESTEFLFFVTLGAGLVLLLAYLRGDR